MNVVSTRLRTGSVLLTLVVLSLATLGARPAYACSCVGTGDAEEAFRRSDAVFSGEVVEIGELPTSREGITTMMPYLAPVTFDVKAAWKGAAGPSVVVHGQGSGASCGLDFERGETYLVFAGGAGRDGGGALQTGLCSATTQTGEETARNMFGPPTGTLPQTGGVSPEGAEQESGARVVAAAAVLSSLAAGAIFAGRLVHGPGR